LILAHVFLVGRKFVQVLEKSGSYTAALNNKYEGPIFPLVSFSGVEGAKIKGGASATIWLFESRRPLLKSRVRFRASGVAARISQN
jgi:hypothetical protein